MWCFVAMAGVCVHMLQHLCCLLNIPICFGLASRSLAGVGVPKISQDGTVDVPLTCSPSSLREFLLQNHREIHHRRKDFERCVDKEMSLVLQTLTFRTFWPEDLRQLIRNATLSSTIVLVSFPYLSQPINLSWE